MILLLLGSMASAAPSHWCGTPDRWAVADPVGLHERVPPPSGADERDVYGVPQAERSEHFVLRYGLGQPSDAEARARLLRAFEDAWTVQIEQLGHSVPVGSPGTLFNVYLGDSGDGAPPSYGAAGYYSVDDEGWPMIVVSVDSLFSPEYADVTAAHEFYHAVQGATGRFDYDVGGPSAWFWEASATWASAMVYPDNDLYASFLFGYALLPHKSLSFFRYPSTGAVEEYYQYGAFIWPLFVSQTTGEPQILVEVWEYPHGRSDPLAAMRDRLAARGLDLDTLWLQHIGRNVIWDYDNGDAYRENIRTASFHPEHANLEAASLSYQGFEGLRDSPESLPLERYGSHTLVLDRIAEGTYHLVIEGDERGTFDSPARFGAVAVITSADALPRYQTVDFDGSRGELSLSELDGVDRVSVVVGAFTEELSPFWRDETFGYRYGLTLEPPESDDPVDPTESLEPRGCGCSSGGSGALGLVWLMPGLLLRRAARRRQDG